ncbi:hypothetical protein [Granulicella sibirica]|uniref:Uncharacterized protein n=1 Tax=Granulicella sibirica TaxID=2479048 RepID=A0A4Q0T2N7_9BACT|nr:hypothetical protein [Granulicella sibirica]RXH56690.1 hypothetical protein GRAN_3547 [Granulicella sibirica]
MKRFILHALALSFVMFAWAVSRAQAQSPSCISSLQQAIARYQKAQLDLAAEKAKAAANQPADVAHAQEEADASSGELHQDLTFEKSSPCMIAAILSNSEYQQNLVSRVKAAYQQNGSSNGSSGTTNVVSKGLAARVLSLASEYGALSESVSGQTVTLSGTLAGIPLALERAKILQPCVQAFSGAKCISFKTTDGLDRVSYSVAFAASQSSSQVTGTASGSTSSTQPTAFNASYQTLQQANVKVVLIKGVAATPDDISKAITALDGSSNILSVGDNKAALLALIDSYKDNAAIWAREEFTRLTGISQSDVSAELASWSQSLPSALCKAKNPCTLQKDAENYIEHYVAYLTNQHDFVESQRKKPIVTAEYDANFPAAQTSNSTARLIAGYTFPKTKLTLTANAAGSFYNGNPSATVPGARVLRDFQAAGELAYTFGSTKTSFLGQSTASAAYYYQDQTSPSILNITPGEPVSGITFTSLPSTATQVFAKRGVINLAQMKFNFIPGKGSIDVPVSVTWSNRTELVTQPVWRTQVGISYDFDSLFSGLGK